MVVNVDDLLQREDRCCLQSARRCARTTVGASDADVYPESVTMSAGGMTIVARIPGPMSGRVELTTRLISAHNVENLLVALGIVSALDLDVQKAADALSNEVGAPGRLERCDGPDDDVVVLVDYAHAGRAETGSRGGAREREARDLSLRLRRRSRSDEARADGRGGGGADSRDRHERQSAERGPGGDRGAARRGVESAGGKFGGRARSRGRHRARRTHGAARRRRSS